MAALRSVGDMTDVDSTADIRSAARRRIGARPGSWRFLALRAVRALLLVGIRAVTSPEQCFWPVRPITGAPGWPFSFLESHGSRCITEDRIGAELARMRG